MVVKGISFLFELFFFKFVFLKAKFTFFFSSDCTITITNVGQVPIEMFEITVQSSLDASTESKVFNWNDEELKKQLPLEPGASTSLTLNLYAVMEFVVPSSAHGTFYKKKSIVEIFN